MRTINPLLKYPSLAFSRLRGLHFFVQMQTLSRLTYALPFIRQPQRVLDKKSIEILLAEINSLSEQEAQNIAEGYYPITVFKPEPFVEHFKRLPSLFIDGIKINWRKKQLKSKAFSKDAEKNAAGLPDYYVRNFHFQTDGYLSEKSAQFYEHQVELLFTGMADAMRRLILKPLKIELASQANTNERLNCLEMGGGTGRSSRFMKLAFENSNITVTDLSAPYLKVAQKKLSDLNDIHFLQADATNTPFKNEAFDVVFCVFLFHELPLAEREKVLQEASRLLKPGGYFAAVDSLQIGDRPVIDSFLNEFPKEFHEPFYTNYIKTPMKDIIEKAGFEIRDTGFGFLSKYWVAKKQEPIS